MKNKESNMQFSTIKDAVSYVGGFAAPSKMPCPSYSLPASACKTGAKLRKVKGSVCSNCYACKGCYVFPVVKNALALRLASIEKDGWTDAMVFSIQKKNLSFFRFHDSGDVQSLEHLRKIVEIAKRCPSCKFWLPTKENGIVLQFLKSEKLPENLTVRLSCPMMDGENLAVKKMARENGLTVAGASSDMGKVNCKAYLTDGKCGDCRACWNKDVFEIVYKKH